MLNALRHQRIEQLLADILIALNFTRAQRLTASKDRAASSFSLTRSIIIRAQRLTASKDRAGFLPPPLIPKKSVLNALRHQRIEQLIADKALMRSVEGAQRLTASKDRAGQLLKPLQHNCS